MPMAGQITAIKWLMSQFGKEVELSQWEPCPCKESCKKSVVLFLTLWLLNERADRDLQPATFKVEKFENTASVYLQMKA